MSTPSPDFKKWLYGSNPKHPMSIKFRDFLKNHSNWEGQSIDDLKIYLDTKGLTAFMATELMESIMEYLSYKGLKDL
jgi:hypothetical protein